MRVALIGCGHIGGSLALALRQAGVTDELVGYDADAAAAGRAVELGICDRVAVSPQAAIAGVAVVIVAVPVRGIVALCSTIASALAGDTVVTDVGSTKAYVVTGAESVLGGRFVGGHPIAGTERSGPDAADGALFRGRPVILTPTPRTDPGALARVSELWRAAGARLIEMEPEHHDRVLAAVSHLPHVAAYALAATVGGARGEVGRDLVGLAGGGFTDTTRIASTPPAMWIDVFLDNRDPILELMDQFVNRIAELRAAIEAGDAPQIERLLREAAAGRKRVLG